MRTKNATTNQTERTPEQIAELQRECQQWQMANAATEGRASLLAAIETMRRFLNDAERDVARIDDPNYPITLATAAQRVMHQISWGHANASSQIETAMRYAVEHEVAKAKLDAK